MDRLSPAQRSVVDCPHDDGHLLVMAAPGSGKTRVITERIGSLLGRGVIEAEQVLVLTFTARAADELRTRLDEHGPGVQAGTFHSICDGLLREHGRAIGLEQPFMICDEVEQETILARLAAQRGSPLARPGELKQLKACISERKRLGVPAGEQRMASPWDGPRTLTLDRAYRGLLAERHALDYDDLILKAIELLQSDAETATMVRNRVRFLFVDEFHDVSREQYELIRLLAPPRSPAHVMAVADSNQAIYGFRGVDAPRLIAAFRRDYRPRRFTLTENYRSAGNLVRAAQAIITADGAHAASSAVHPDDYPIDYTALPDDEAEAAHLVHQIERACATGRYTYGDIAVLYRIHSRADRLEEALLRHDIPLTRHQPGRFFDRPAVQATLRYLALLAALHDDDFEPALNWPRVLVDELTMIHLRRTAQAAGLSVSRLARDLDRYAGRLSPLTRVAIRRFMDTIAAELLPVADAPINTIAAKLLAVLARRRSPIPIARREDAAAVLEVLARPLVEPIMRLHVAITAGRPVVLRHTGGIDSAAAATIVEHVLIAYLQHPVCVRREGEAAAPGEFVVCLGTALRPDEDGLVVTLRDARTIRFSLSTQAWRLGQMLLMRFETLRDDPFVLVDTETTGLHIPTAELMEVAALKLCGGIPQPEQFHSMVRPRGRIPAAATNIHGIGARDVAGAPPPAAVLADLSHFTGNATVVGHNLHRFDHPLLCRVAGGLDLPLLTNPTLDTCTLAQRLLPHGGHTLEELAQRFGIPTAQTHRAPDDVRLNADVFAHLLDLLAAEKELDVLDEALPLVGLGNSAAAIPPEGENELLATMAARAIRAGLGDRLLARLITLADEPGRIAVGLEWLRSFPVDEPAEDQEWQAMNERWQELLAHYCRTTDDHSLAAFLQYARLAQAIDYRPDAQGRVTLMTIHAAKGREWPLVFLIGAEDDLLPMGHSPRLSEERRILYVAMTRAKRRLCISWAQHRQGRARQPSRFLCALPAELLVRRTAGTVAGAKGARHNASGTG